MGNQSADSLGALRMRIDVAPTQEGPLDGLTFAVKDMFDVAGIVTGGGNPDWLASHAPASRTAPAVQACLHAGARLTGITIADELAFSPFGENVHYGTPRNPAASGRVPGGSSSGSASAVAGGLVDFALGTDTAGSVRIPASFCGVFGMRPTHGRICAEGVMPLAPSFDTVGWLARDAEMLEVVGQTLLNGAATPVRRVFWLEDAFPLCDGQDALQQAAERAVEALGAATVRRIRLDGAEDATYADWLAAFNGLRAREIWDALGPWITRSRPRLAIKTATRFAAVEQAAGADTSAEQAFRVDVRRRCADRLGDDGVLLLPSVPYIAPRAPIGDDEAPALRERLFRLTCLSPMLGFPEVSMPLASFDGCPMGLSLIGPENGDRMLLAAARQVAIEHVAANSGIA